MKLKQFTTSSKELINQDADYWLSAVKCLLELYRKSEPTEESRAYAAAKLAGLGLAMHEHFSSAVDTLADLENRTVVDIGVIGYDIGAKHSRSMEEVFRKTAS